MTNMMETAQSQLRELLMQALGQLTAEGKISAESLPAFKIEVPAEDTSFSPNAFLHLLSYNGSHETVRCYPVSKASGKELEDYLSERKIPLPASDFVMLTNRMIELLYGREWYEHTEETPGLFGAPIVVYEPRPESYDIGIPKADQVHRVLLSTSLYREKLPLSRHYEYLIFNPYADSRMYLNLENADYGDNGRVKDKRGNRGAQKVMLPRYYRLMMGYLEKPLKSIRAEEYRRICDRITDPALQKDFDTCYEKVSGQAYYMLRDTFESEERRQIFESSCERVIRHLTEIGVYSGIHLIRIPKKERKRKTLRERIRAFRTGLREAVYRKAIGQAEYILKTCWAGDTDDKNNVARLNSNMMSLIGVSENDKIRIRFGPREITLRILSREDLTDYEPIYAADLAPASERQLQLLEKRGINPDSIPNAGYARNLIERLLNRQAAGLATPKQIRFLENKGFTHVGSWFFDDARSMIDRIAGNGWKVPHDIWPATYQPHRIEI